MQENWANGDKACDPVASVGGTGGQRAYDLKMEDASTNIWRSNLRPVWKPQFLIMFNYNDILHHIYIYIYVHAHYVVGYPSLCFRRLQILHLSPIIWQFDVWDIAISFRQTRRTPRPWSGCGKRWLRGVDGSVVGTPKWEPQSQWTTPGFQKWYA